MTYTPPKSKKTAGALTLILLSPVHQTGESTCTPHASAVVSLTPYSPLPRQVHASSQFSPPLSLDQPNAQ
jgi:hypothetical protein